jgi:hypothetical protein
LQYADMFEPGMVCVIRTNFRGRTGAVTATILGTHTNRSTDK